jgi:hypothetical protein
MDSLTLTSISGCDFPMKAKPNGLFPVQHRINARLDKALRNMRVGGKRRILIPWSDFAFSNAEAWPRQFQEGLDRYCDYFLNVYSPLGSVDPDKYLESYTIANPDDLYQILDENLEGEVTPSEPLTPLQVLDAMTPRTVVWSLKQKKEMKAWEVPLLALFLPRHVDCEGVRLSIRKLDRTVFQPLRGSFRWRFDDIEIHTPLEESTFAHETMHLVQAIGNNLLFARAKPEIAFVDAEPQGAQYGVPKKELRPKEMKYAEDPDEFYPWAYSLAVRAVQSKKKLPLVERIVLATIGKSGISHLKGIRNYKHRKKLLESAYRYALLQTGEAVDEASLRRLDEIARVS